MASPADPILIYATFPDAESARVIAGRIVDQRLAACANILGAMTAVYRWEGAVTGGDEVAVIFKTTVARAEAAIAEISRHHPYDVPAIVSLEPSGGHAPFLHWLATETRATDRPDSQE
ncbi:MAG: divalent-cation tolerance protein CutA [Pseudomonadota bacterium]